MAQLISGSAWQRDESKDPITDRKMYIYSATKVISATGDRTPRMNVMCATGFDIRVAYVTKADIDFSRGKVIPVIVRFDDAPAMDITADGEVVEGELKGMLQFDKLLLHFLGTHKKFAIRFPSTTGTITDVLDISDLPKLQLSADCGAANMVH